MSSPIRCSTITAAPHTYPGSFFGGRPRAIEWWRETYYAYHDAYLERGIFVGKDQTLMNATLMVHGTRVFAVWYSDPDTPAHSAMPSSKQRMLGECGGSWFYYQFWLAGAREKELMRGLWNTQNGVWFWWYVRGVWQRLTGRERVHGVVQACRHLFIPDHVPRLVLGLVLDPVLVEPSDRVHIRHAEERPRWHPESRVELGDERCRERVGEQLVDNFAYDVLDVDHQILKCDERQLGLA